MCRAATAGSLCQAAQLIWFESNNRPMSRVRTIAINAADHLVAKNRLEAAAAILEKYLSTHRDCPEVLRRLGRIRLAMRQPDDAAALFERSLAAHRADDRSADTGEYESMTPLN